MILQKSIRINSLVLGAGILCSCGGSPRFEKMDAAHTGVTFQNDIKATTELNIFNYLYFYNGGGAAAGDLNSDGLADLVFTSNLHENAVYINKGNFEFTDISDRIAQPRGHKWTTGVSLADVNADGLLDIYLSEVGSYLQIEGGNQLWINQGNDADGLPTFKEQSKKFGLDLVGFGTQSAFFDYDLDGDLDVYILNHSVHSNGTFGNSKKREESHPLAGDRFMENRDGKFVDITKEAGIFNSPLGYGLGITVSDINDDGYPDVYIGNDFHEDDYLYINQGDGTFRESLADMVNHTSRFSMGNDIADINNDGLLDIFSLDMLPEDYEKLKASAGEDAYDIYMFKLNFGYKHQHARNTLQLNRGENHYSEIGLLAGVAATDWSWSGLLADLDLDGYEDIFIANGILGRTNDMDYINYVSNDAIQYRLEGDITDEELALSEKMPVVKIHNYAYHNRGNLTFEDVSDSWGLSEESFSNGAVYADLDNDGDLDLAVNNINQPVSIYQNHTLDQDPAVHFLRFHVTGRPGNLFGIGTRIRVQLNDSVTITRELFPVRGYESSMDYTLEAGLGAINTVPLVQAIFPGGYILEMNNVSVDQTLELDFSQVTEKGISKKPLHKYAFTDVTDSVKLDYLHTENKFVEFNREVLIPHMVSAEGPAVAIADVDGDGLDDVFLGGAKHQPAILYHQVEGLVFLPDTLPGDLEFEDVDAAFADFNADGFLDLIIASGGNEYRGSSQYRKPRLYFNDGAGHMLRDTTWISGVYLNGSVVAPVDWDGDGDLDLFLGARSVPWSYGVAPESYFLENTGKGFQVMKQDWGTYGNQLGMVTAAAWADMDRNGLPDLVVLSEWSTVKVLYQDEQEVTLVELAHSTGLWSGLTIADLNNDELPDIVGGNLGSNSKLAQDGSGSLNMYVADFDDNEFVEQLVTQTKSGREEVFSDKMELSKQMVSVKKKFTDFKSFSQAKLTDMVSTDKLKSAVRYEVKDTRSAVFYQKGNRSYQRVPLPVSGQFSPVHAAMITDVNADGLPDLFTAGNFSYANIQRGMYDASYGEVFLQDEKGILRAVDQSRTGFYLRGDVKYLGSVQSSRGQLLMVVRNNGRVQFFKSNMEIASKLVY